MRLETFFLRSEASAAHDRYVDGWNRIFGPKPKKMKRTVDTKSSAEYKRPCARLPVQSEDGPKRPE